MPSRSTLPLLLAALLLLPGCFERTETITLNPDGSGKSQVEFVLFPVPNNPDLGNLSPKEQARKRARDIMKYAKGVDAWKDVTSEPGPEGRTRFKATVYFKNVAEYKIDQIGIVHVAWEKDPQGGMNLTVGKGGIQPDAKPADAPQPTDDQVAEQIKALRESWQQQLPLTTLIKNLKIDLTFILPGKPDDTAILQPVPAPGTPASGTSGGGGVRYLIDGGKLVAALEAWVKDDARLTAAVKAGESLQNPSAKLTNGIIFDKPTQARAHVPGELKPLFDYAAEADAARKDQPAMLRRAGLADETTPAPPLDAPVTPMPVP